jgi:hypothetical protein
MLWWRRGKDQWVFAVTASDGRRGYALCGDLFFGLWADEVTFKWEA